MNFICKLLRGNCLPRLIVGLLVGFYIYQGTLDHRFEPWNLIPSAQAIESRPNVPPDYSDRIKQLAQTDHIASP